ncbi:MAG TPA: hypothetical protein VE978_10475 [Chitinophagales bacterium]|nr:hypothetical protein [Chitinophagales bacterium]
MRSKTTEQFRKCFSGLPQEIQESSRKAYLLWKDDPYHPSLKFKKVHTRLPCYSARISDTYRAVCLIDNDEYVWFWIGIHADYDKLLKKL